MKAHLTIHVPGFLPAHIAVTLEGDEPVATGDNLINLDEACALTGFCRPTVLRYAKSGAIPSVMVGKRYFFTPASLQRFMAPK